MFKNTIKLEKIIFFGFHGINENEVKNGQNFVLDLILNYKVFNATDNIKDYIDYSELYSLIKNSFEEERHNLLESLGSKILEDIKVKYRTVYYMKLNMRKPSLSIDGNKDFINVELEYKEW